MRNRYELHEGLSVEEELHEGQIAAAPHDEKRTFGSNLFGPAFKFREVQRRLTEIVADDECVIGNHAFSVCFFGGDSYLLRQISAKLFRTTFSVYG